MKVLLLNGSTRKNGCTYLALSEVAKELNTQDVETEIIQLGSGLHRLQQLPGKRPLRI